MNKLLYIMHSARRRIFLPANWT